MKFSLDEIAKTISDMKFEGANDDVATATGVIIRALQSDNPCEYMGRLLSAFCVSQEVASGLEVRADIALVSMCTAACNLMRKEGAMRREVEDLLLSKEAALKAIVIAMKDAREAH